MKKVNHKGIFLFGAILVTLVVVGAAAYAAKKKMKYINISDLGIIIIKKKTKTSK